MGSTGQAKREKAFNATTPRLRILCAKLPDGHLKFECSVLHSNVDFYFKFDKYSKFAFTSFYQIPTDKSTSD